MKGKGLILFEWEAWKWKGLIKDVGYQFGLTR